MPFFRLFPALFLAVFGLLAPPARAQSVPFASYTQFNDTLVARFNRGDFQGIEVYGSPALRQLEAAGSLSRFLASWQTKTGRVLSSVPLQVRGQRQVFAWNGERQNLRVSWRSPTPGIIDDYTISDFIAQPLGRSAPVLTDNQQHTPLDQAVHRAALLYLQHPDAAGLSIGIYHRGQQSFYNYGEVAKGSGRLPTRATYYDLGSVAKTFLGTLLAQAVLDHKLQLTDDIRQYLPGQYPNLVVDGRPIQLVDLANHTSGLGGTSHTYIPATKAQRDRLSWAAKIATYNTYTADSLLLDLHHLQLATKPGTTYRYSGVGMFVLQLVLERVYQLPYEQLVTQYVQTRFSMRDTKRVLAVREQQRSATGYPSPQVPQAHVNYTGYWGGPGMSSTPADLVKYLRANLIARAPAVRLAHQRTWGTAPGFGVGLGWMLDSDAEGNDRIYHNGKTIGYNTRLVLYPGQDLGLVLLVNENSSQDRLTELEEMITQYVLQPAAPKENLRQRGSH